MLSKLSQRVKNSFITGVIVSAPIFITVAIFYYVLARLDSFLGEIFRHFIRLPGGGRIPGLGLIALVVIVFCTGELTRWYVGRKLLGTAERLFIKIPVLRTLYNALKQMGNYIMVSRRKVLFRQVVLVEWPNEKTFTLGFLTDNLFEEKGADSRVSVYIPTAPNPTSGYLLYVEKKQVKLTTLSIEEGMKIILSAGVIQDPTRFMIK